MRAGRVPRAKPKFPRIRQDIFQQAALLVPPVLHRAHQSEPAKSAPANPDPVSPQQTAQRGRRGAPPAPLRAQAPRFRPGG